MTRRIAGMTHQEILTKQNKDTLPQDDWGYETLRRWEDAPQGDGENVIPEIFYRGSRPFLVLTGTIMVKETLRRWEDAPQGDGVDVIPKCGILAHVPRNSRAPALSF